MRGNATQNDLNPILPACFSFDNHDWNQGRKEKKKEEDKKPLRKLSGQKSFEISLQCMAVIGLEQSEQRRPPSLWCVLRAAGVSTKTSLGEGEGGWGWVWSGRTQGLIGTAICPGRMTIQLQRQLGIMGQVERAATPLQFTTELPYPLMSGKMAWEERGWWSDIR